MYNNFLKRVNKTKTKFRKKIVSVFIILTLTIALNSNIYAQIQYESIEKTITNGQAWSWDLVFYGAYTDFFFIAVGNSKADWVNIIPVNSQSTHEILCDTLTYMGNTLYMPKVLNEGDSIDDNQSFWRTSGTDWDTRAMICAAATSSVT